MQSLPATASQPEILLIDDNQAMVGVLAVALKLKGYRVLEATDGETGLLLALDRRPELVVLDLDLPKLDGLHVCQELRRVHFDAPILMLTGRTQVHDRIVGLNAGADDYLPKPFDAQEFLARVNALLRRRQRHQHQTLVLELGPVQVDLAHKTATKDGQPLSLTRTEYALLDLLARNAGRPVSRETILDSVWGYDQFPSTRTVDTHVWRLRKKLGDDAGEPRWIKGIPGHGYALLLPEASPPRPADRPGLRSAPAQE
ncbi:MAG TPA: response regulator transcription factor [Opitutaceae bacterium]